MDGKKIYSLREIVSHAYRHSPFYRKLYESHGVTEKDLDQLTRLPVISQNEFWDANTLENNTLCTGPLSNGIVFKSGGTTGRPKFSVYTREEWATFTREFGEALGQTGLSAGDRVANLFYAGNLYASFLFIHESLERCPVPVMQFPLSGQISMEDMAKILTEFQINVLAGVPTTLLSLLQFLVDRKSDFPMSVNLKKIYFGGESLYPDQRNWILQHWPEMMISSVGYASVDAGHLGKVDPSCQYNEHDVFSQSSIMEILDEGTGKPILEPLVPGKLVYTNLTRLLMPIIRYPVGDRGMWVDNRNQRFQILGRSEEGARIGPVTLNRDDLSKILDPLRNDLGFLNFQVILEHFENKDRLVLRLAVDGTGGLAGEGKEERILDELYLQRPHLKDEVMRKHVHPVKVEFVLPEDLVCNDRTGKLKFLMDLRNK